jgi:hypothetical protein
MRICHLKKKRNSFASEQVSRRGPGEEKGDRTIFDKKRLSLDKAK